MEAKQKFTEQHKQKSAELEFQIFNLEEQLSSNINEVIRAVLNFLFFLRKDFTHIKSTKSTKHKQATFAQIFFIPIKNTKRKKATFTQMFYKRTKRKQAPFAQMFFYTHKKHKKYKKHKKHKKYKT